MRAVLIAFLAALAFSASARATAPDLQPLAAALAPLRSTKGANPDRDAGPELTPVKHALRAWVEAQLPGRTGAGTNGFIVNSPLPEDTALLSRRLSAALETADLTCEPVQRSSRRCDGGPSGDFDARGYVGRVRIAPLDDARYLLVTTEVGVRCGYDESAYLYAMGPDARWRIVFETVQDDYRDGHYKPQNFLAVDVSRAAVAWNEPAPPPLVLTLGYSPWCASTWQIIYSRLWRASAVNPAPRPLLDLSDELNIGDDFVAAGRVTRGDALIEYRGRSVDAGVLIRPHVLHYTIGPNDRLERIAPVALSPNDFVEEWLTSPWSQARRWIEPRDVLGALIKLHEHADAGGEFDGPALRCRRDPDLWQVGLSDHHFLVRWRAPYRFTLVAAHARPFAGCDRKVPMPDNIGTLFPLQGWTP